MDLIPIADKIWNDKYRLTGHDQCIEHTWRRVAKCLAAVEEAPVYWEDLFYTALEDFKFLPAGRIMAGADSGRDVTLYNCFVNGTLPDDLHGLYEHLGEAAQTMKQGGGIGYDFSTIRPKGDLVEGVHAPASGPLAFMDLWNSMSKTIMSAGSREGAMMATMRCDHPDIEAFIDAKRDRTRLRQFNLSVLVTDKFMEAVRGGKAWTLEFNGRIYRHMLAADLWDKIMRSTYDMADPGVLFIDCINDTNNLKYCEVISATNPCGEVPLQPYGACLLGSINLTRFVSHPYTPEARVDNAELRRVVGLAVRMLDNVVDVSQYPLPQHETEARSKRRIGLGITGLADALLMCGILYGSDRAVQWTRDVIQQIEEAAYSISIELAATKEKFPACQNDYMADHLSGNDNLIHLLSPIRVYGLRNSHLMSIAPTGTISLLANNVSSGCEPIFAPSYDRRVRNGDGTFTVDTVTDYAVALWQKMQGDKSLPPALVTAQDLSWQDHLRMAAVLQEHVDQSISKTINLPVGISYGEFKQVYTEAYRLGLKGCTTFRPNEYTGSVLTAPAAEPPRAVAGVDLASRPDETVSTLWQAGKLVGQAAEPRPIVAALPSRGAVLEGKTYKLRWEPTDSTVYLTINDKTMPDATRRPFEVLILTKNAVQYTWVSALTLMISAVFRRDDDASFVAEELAKVYDPAGGAWIGGKWFTSLPALIGATIAQHSAGTDKAAPVSQYSSDSEPFAGASTVRAALRCVKCSSPDVHKADGCMTCRSCGHSKCE